MANFSIKTDLMKLSGSFVTNIKGKTSTKRCIVIPVDDAGLFIGEKGVYLNMTAKEMQTPKFGDTHCLKVSIDNETYKSLSEEERKSIPIIGGMHELDVQQRAMGVQGTLDASQCFDIDAYDLPF